MSRDPSRGGISLSATQRRAILVVACCLAAIIVSVLLAWVLLPSLLQDKTVYDPTLYPVDTTLGAVLTQGTENPDYMTGTVVAGDQQAAALQSQGLLSLDQFAGAQSLDLASALQAPCVYFVDDPASYTVVQGLAKMRPRRIVLLFGSNDLGGKYDTADAFIADYRKLTGAVRQAYADCDLIVASIAPVRADANNAASRQLRADEYNQALAQMCQSDGYRFLNSAEILKGGDGYAQESYFDANTGAFTAAGGNAFLMYLRQHPCPGDRLYDPTGIPRRTDQPGSSTSAATPSATPTGYAVTYIVEDATRGSLSTTTTTGLAPGSATTKASRLEFTVPEGTTIEVKAEANEGWCFLRWDDANTNAERKDFVTTEHTYVAVFAKPSVEILLNNSHCDNMQDITGIIEVGGSYPFTARVYMDGTLYDAGTSAVQWVVNENIVTTGPSFTFKPTQGGNYTIMAGVEINGVMAAASVSATVSAPATPPPATTVTITYTTNSIQVGGSATLTANVTNPVGETSWSCDQAPDWAASGATATFSAAAKEPGSYVIRATNNGVTATVTITVVAAGG